MIWEPLSYGKAVFLLLSAKIDANGSAVYIKKKGKA